MREIKVTLEGKTKNGQLIRNTMTIEPGKEPKDLELLLRKTIIEFTRSEVLVTLGKVKGLTILEEAEEIINGPRRASYGPVEESFERVALVWSGILGTKVTAIQVALMMTGLKLCREGNAHHRDNLVDIVGYTLLLEKLIDINKDHETSN